MAAATGTREGEVSTALSLGDGAREGDGDRAGGSPLALGLARGLLGLGPWRSWAADGPRWPAGLSLSHSKTNKNKTEIRKKTKRG